MPCNAHNHDPDCECGWGGMGGESSRGGLTSSRTSIHQPESGAESRAGTCGYCLAAVYFHTNGHGDFVVFDELEPPWPKHPCYELGSDASVQAPVAIPYDAVLRERIRAGSSARCGRAEEAALAASRASVTFKEKVGDRYYYDVSIPEDLIRTWDSELHILGPQRIKDRRDSFKARAIEVTHRAHSRRSLEEGLSAIFPGDPKLVQRLLHKLRKVRG